MQNLLVNSEAQYYDLLSPTVHHNDKKNLKKYMCVQNIIINLFVLFVSNRNFTVSVIHTNEGPLGELHILVV